MARNDPDFHSKVERSESLCYAEINSRGPEAKWPRTDRSPSPAPSPWRVGGLFSRHGTGPGVWKTPPPGPLRAVRSAAVSHPADPCVSLGLEGGAWTPGNDRAGTALLPGTNESVCLGADRAGPVLRHSLAGRTQALEAARDTPRHELSPGLCEGWRRELSPGSSPHLLAQLGQETTDRDLETQMRVPHTPRGRGSESRVPAGGGGYTSSLRRLAGPAHGGRGEELAETALGGGWSPHENCPDDPVPSQRSCFLRPSRWASESRHAGLRWTITWSGAGVAWTRRDVAGQSGGRRGERAVHREAVDTAPDRKSGAPARGSG